MSAALVFIKPRHSVSRRGNGWHCAEVASRHCADTLRGLSPAHVIALHNGVDDAVWTYLVEDILRPMTIDGGKLDLYRAKYLALELEPKP